MGVGDSENHRGSICSDKPRALQEDGRKKKKKPAHHLKKSLINLSPERKALLERVWSARGSQPLKRVAPTLALQRFLNYIFSVGKDRQE